MSYDTLPYQKEGKVFENKTAEIIQRFVGGKCLPSTDDENKNDHIDLHWIYNDVDYPIDVKGPKKYNRWDSNTQFSDVVWIEGQNVNGNPGWVYGKSYYIAFWLKNGITFVRTEKLRKLYDVYLKDKKLHVGTKPNGHYELYRRQGRSDITFTMPAEDLLKIQEYTIQFSELQKLNYKI
jgi:hypothetical protein